MITKQLEDFYYERKAIFAIFYPAHMQLTKLQYFPFIFTNGQNFSVADMQSHSATEKLQLKKNETQKSLAQIQSTTLTNDN